MEHEQSDLIKIGQAARALGICVETLRKWEARGWLVPTFKSGKSTGGTRYYSRQVIQKLTKSYIEDRQSLRSASGLTPHMSATTPPLTGGLRPVAPQPQAAPRMVPTALPSRLVKPSIARLTMPSDPRLTAPSGAVPSAAAIESTRLKSAGLDRLAQLGIRLD
jgi:hypothetical protein